MGPDLLKGRRGKALVLSCVCLLYAINGISSVISILQITHMSIDEILLSESPIVNATWFSHELLSPMPLEDNSYLEGDQIVVRGEFMSVPSQMDLAVIHSNLSMITGIHSTGGGELIVSEEEYWCGPEILVEYFAWSRVDGIFEGDTVRIEVNFTNGDSDILVFWADTDNTTWTYGNNLVEDQMSTGAKPEVGSFIADRCGSIMIGVYDYDMQEGTYTYIVDTRSSTMVETSGSSVSMVLDERDDSRPVDFLFTGLTVNSSILEYIIRNVTILNIFAPVFTHLEVMGLAAVKAVSWTIYDRNVEDTHLFDVLISADSGTSFQLLAANLQCSNYSWDSTGWYKRDYRIQIRCNDSFGFQVSIFSQDIDAGTVPFQHDIYPSIQSSGDISIYQHQRAHIEWTISSIVSGTYRVLADQTLIKNGTIPAGISSIVIVIENMPVGSFEYMLEIRLSSGRNLCQTTHVEVLETTMHYQIALGLSFGITTGSIAIIIIGLVGLVRRRRNQVVLPSNLSEFLFT